MNETLFKGEGERKNMFLYACHKLAKKLKNSRSGNRLACLPVRVELTAFYKLPVTQQRLWKYE